MSAPAECVMHLRVNVHEGERDLQAIVLALQIADEVVRSDIESNCGHRLDRGIYWCDTANTDERDAIDRAIRYIELREPDAFPFRFIRHPQQTHLVRFKDLP